MKFKLESVENSNQVQLTFTLNYDQALEMISLVKGEINVQESDDKFKYIIDLEKTRTSYINLEGDFESIECVTNIRRVIGLGRLKDAIDLIQNHPLVLSNKMVRELGEYNIYLTRI